MRRSSIAGRRGPASGANTNSAIRPMRPDLDDTARGEALDVPTPTRLFGRCGPSSAETRCHVRPECQHQLGYSADAAPAQTPRPCTDSPVPTPTRLFGRCGSRTGGSATTPMSGRFASAAAKIAARHCLREVAAKNRPNFQRARAASAAGVFGASGALASRRRTAVLSQHRIGVLIGGRHVGWRPRHFDHGRRACSAARRA
jgi:hypothetical protein